MRVTSRIGRTVAAVGVLAALAACDTEWRHVDGGPDRARANAGPVGITTGNVVGLTEDWTVVGPSGDLAFGDGNLYAAGGSTLYRIDPASGAIVWASPTPEPITGGPIAESSDSIRVSFGQDRATHGRETTFDSNGYSTGTSDPEGAVPIAGRLATRRDGHSVRMSTPSVPYFPSWLQVSGTVVSGGIPPALFEPTLGADRVFVPIAYNGHTSAVAAYDLDDACPDDVCQEAWLTFIPAGDSPALGADGTLYVGGGPEFEFGGRVAALEPDTGAIVWTSDQSLAAATPSVTEDAVYVAGSSSTALATRVLALDPASGDEQWIGTFPGDPGPSSGRLPTGAGITAVGGDVLYVAHGSTVAAYTAAGCGSPTCPPIWTEAVDAAVHGLAVTGGRLYVSTDAGLVAFAPT